MRKKKKQSKSGTAEFSPRSTTQGGSNFGQGSSQLGKDSQHQGESKNDGSNYENETGWYNEALRFSDIKTKKE